jgi:hypothetical protein
MINLSLQSYFREKFLKRAVKVRATRQYFAGMDVYDAVVSSTGLSSGTIYSTEAGIWPGASMPAYSAIPANDMRAGKVYECKYGGLFQSGTSGYLTCNPRIGTSTTVASNTTMGISCETASITGSTSGLMCYGETTLVVIGISISSNLPVASVTCNGYLMVGMNTGSNQAASTLITFGGTPATGVAVTSVNYFNVGVIGSQSNTGFTYVWVTFRSLN